MIFHFKFRKYGDEKAEKVSYNFRDEMVYRFNLHFHPVVENESPCYSLYLRNGRTLVTFHSPDSFWNGNHASGETFEIRAGHILSTKGILLEILECPENSDHTDSEITKFIDLRAFAKEGAKRAEPPTSFQASTEAIGKEETGYEVPDKFVIPISTIKNSDPSGESQVENSSEEKHFWENVKIDSSPDQAEAWPNPSHNQVAQDGKNNEKNKTKSKESSSAVEEKNDKSSLASSALKIAEKRSGDPTLKDNTPRNAMIVALMGISLIFISHQLARKYLLISWEEMDFEIPTVSRTVRKNPIQEMVETQQRKNKNLGATSPIVNGSNDRGVAAQETKTIQTIPGEARPLNQSEEGLKKAPETTTQTKPLVSIDKELKSQVILAKTTQLMSAIEEGNLKSVEKLMEIEGGALSLVKDEIGRAPLLRAAATGRLSIMQFILSKNASLYLTDNEGNNALMWAVITGREKTVEFLLNRDFDVFYKRNDGKTVLDLARDYKQNRIEKILLLTSAKKKSASNPGSSRSPSSR